MTETTAKFPSRAEFIALIEAYKAFDASSLDAYELRSYESTPSSLQAIVEHYDSYASPITYLNRQGRKNWARNMYQYAKERLEKWNLRKQTLNSS